MAAKPNASLIMKSPSAERNREPIRDVLKQYLPFDSKARVLGVASGSGTHDAFFAPQWPHVSFNPTDIDEPSRASLWARVKRDGITNVSVPVHGDVLAPYEHWPVSKEPYDVVLNFNMIHISPWECTLGLMKVASSALKEGGILFMYGPYNVDGKFTSEGNAKFDVSLKSRNPSWGIRDLEAVVREAQQVGLEFVEKHDMPANNLSVIFRRQAAQ